MELATNITQLERRAYGPDSSEDEKHLIQSMVYMHTSEIIYWNEVPVMSVWQVEQFGIKLEQLTKKLERFYLLIDLTDSKPPNARIRRALRTVFSPLNEAGIIKAAAFTEKNFVINVAAKFVLGGSGLDFSVHTKRLEAEAHLGVS